MAANTLAKFWTDTSTLQSLIDKKKKKKKCAKQDEGYKLSL